MPRHHPARNISDGDRAETAGLPRVSVVIPVRTEADSLPALIESLRAQTSEPDEIVIVDGGSTDDTVGLLHAFAATDPRVRLIEAGPATPGRGRNVGIAAARHEWIALTDAGVRVEPTWLEELLRAVERQPDADLVHGSYEPVANTFFTRCAALTYVPPRQERPGGWMRGPSTTSMLLRREAWQRAGGFPDLRAAEDLIFLERVSLGGCRIAWAPHAMVWWQLQPSLRRTFGRFVTYSRHNVWAGRQRGWHYGMARQYAVAAILLIPAFVYSRWWLAVPVAGVMARAARSLWRRRGRRGFVWAPTAAHFGGVLGMLLAIDLATFIGWAQALWRSGRPRDSSAAAPVHDTKSFAALNRPLP